MDQKSPGKTTHITVVGASLLVAVFGEAPQKLECFLVAHGKAKLPPNLNNGEPNKNAQEWSAAAVITYLSIPNSGGTTRFTKALSEDLEYLERYNVIVKATYADLLTSETEHVFMAKT